MKKNLCQSVWKNNQLMICQFILLWFYYNSACLVILHAFLSSADFFQNNIFEKFFQEYHQNVKQF